MAIAKTPSAAYAGLQALQRILCEDLDDLAATGMHSSDMEWTRRCPQQLADCMLLLEVSESAGKWNNLDLFTRYFRSMHAELALPALRCFRAVATAVASLPLDNAFRWRWMAVVLTSGDSIPLLLDVLVSGAAAEADGSWRQQQRTTGRSDALAKAAVESVVGSPIVTAEDEAEVAGPLQAARAAASEALAAALPKPKKGSVRAELPPPPGPEEVLEAARALRVLCEEVFHPMRQPQHAGDAVEARAQQALGGAAYARAVNCARQQLGLKRAVQAAHGAQSPAAGGAAPEAAALAALRSTAGQGLSELSMGAHAQDVSHDSSTSDSKLADDGPPALGASPAAGAQQASARGDADADGFVGPHFTQAVSGEVDAQAAGGEASEAEAEVGDIEGALMAAGQGGAAASQVWGSQFIFNNGSTDAGEAADADAFTSESARDRAAAASDVAGTAGAVSVLLGSAAECGRMRVGHAAVETAGGDVDCALVHAVVPTASASGSSAPADSSSALQLCLSQPAEGRLVMHVDDCGAVAPPHPARRPLLELLSADVELVGVPEEEWGTSGAGAVAALLRYCVLPLHAPSTEEGNEFPAAVAEVLAAQLEEAEAGAGADGVTVPQPLLGGGAEYSQAQLAAARAVVLQRKIRGEGVALLSAMTFGSALSPVWHGAGALPGVLQALRGLKGQLAQAVLAVKYARLKQGQKEGLAPKSARSPRAGSRSKSPASPKGGSKGSPRGSPRSGSRKKSRGSQEHKEEELQPEESKDADDIAEYSLPAGVHFDDVPGPDTTAEDALKRNYSAEAVPDTVAKARTPEERFMLETTAAIEAGLNAAYRLVGRSGAEADMVHAEAAARRSAIGQFQRALATAEASAGAVRAEFEQQVAADEAAAAAAVAAAAAAAGEGAAGGGKKKKASGKDTKGKKGGAPTDDSAETAAAIAAADARHRLAWLQTRYGALVPEDTLRQAAEEDSAAAADEARATCAAVVGAAADGSGSVLALAGPRPVPTAARTSSFWAAAEAAVAAAETGSGIQDSVSELALLSAQFASCPWDASVCGVLRAAMGVLRSLLGCGTQVQLGQDAPQRPSTMVVHCGSGFAGMGDPVRLLALEQVRVLPCLLGLLRHPLASAQLRDEAEATVHMLLQFNDAQGVAVESAAPGVLWAQSGGLDALSSPTLGDAHTEFSNALGVPPALATVVQAALREHSTAESWFGADGNIDVDGMPVGALAALRSALEGVGEDTCAADNPFHALATTLRDTGVLPELPGQQLAAWRLGGQMPTWGSGGLLARLSPATSHIPQSSISGCGMDVRCVLPHADTNTAAAAGTWQQWAAAATLNAAAGGYHGAAPSTAEWSDATRASTSTPVGRWAGVAGIMSLLASDAVAELALVLQGGHSLPAVPAPTGSASQPHAAGAVPSAMAQAIRGVLRGVLGKLPENAAEGAEQLPVAQLPALRLLAGAVSQGGAAAAAGDEQELALALTLEHVMTHFAPGMHSLMLRFPDPSARGADAFPPQARADAVAAMDATLDSGKGSKKKRTASDAGAEDAAGVHLGVASMRELCTHAQRVLAGIHGVALPAVGQPPLEMAQLSHVQDAFVRAFLTADLSVDSSVDDGFAEAAFLCALPPLALPAAAGRLKDADAPPGKKDKKKAGKDKKKATSKGKDAEGGSSNAQGALQAAAALAEATQHATVAGVPWHQDTLLRGQRLVFSMLQGIKSDDVAAQTRSAALLHVLAGSGVTPLLLRTAAAQATTATAHEVREDAVSDSKEDAPADSGVGRPTESLEPVPRIAGLSPTDLSLECTPGSAVQAARVSAVSNESTALACMSLSLLLRLSPIAAAHMSAAAAWCVPAVVQCALAPQVAGQRSVPMRHVLIPRVVGQGPIAVSPSVGSSVVHAAPGGCSNTANHHGCEALAGHIDLRHCLLDVVAAIAEADSLHRIHGQAPVSNVLHSAVSAACSASLDALEAEGAAASLGSKKPKGSVKSKGAGSKGAKGGKSARDHDDPAAQAGRGAAGTCGVDVATPSWSPGFVAARRLAEHLSLLSEAMSHAGVMLDLGVHAGAKLLVAVTALLRVPGVKQHMLRGALDKCREPWWMQVQDMRQRLRTVATRAHESHAELQAWLQSLPTGEPAAARGAEAALESKHSAEDEAEASPTHASADDHSAALEGFARRVQKQHTSVEGVLTAALQCVVPNDIPAWALDALATQNSTPGLRGIALPACEGAPTRGLFAFGGAIPQRPASARKGKGDKSPRTAELGGAVSWGEQQAHAVHDAALWDVMWSSHVAVDGSTSDDLDAEWLQGTLFEGAFVAPESILATLLPEGVAVQGLGQASLDSKKGKASPRSKGGKKGKGDADAAAADTREWIPLPALLLAAGGARAEEATHGDAETKEDCAPLQLSTEQAQQALTLARSWRRIQVRLQQMGALLACVTRADDWCPFAEAFAFSLTPSLDIQKQLLLAALGDTGASLGPVCAWDALQASSRDAKLGAPELDTGARIQGALHSADKKDPDVVAADRVGAAWGPLQALQASSKAAVSGTMLELLLVQGLTSQSHPSQLSLLAPKPSLVPVDETGDEQAVGTAHPVHTALAATGVLGSMLRDGAFASGSQQLHTELLCAAAVRSGCVVQLLGMLDPLPPLPVGEAVHHPETLVDWIVQQSTASTSVGGAAAADMQQAAATAINTVVQLDDTQVLQAASQLAEDFATAGMTALSTAQRVATECTVRAGCLVGPLPGLQLASDVQDSMVAAVYSIVQYLVTRGDVRGELWTVSQQELSAEAVAAAAAAAAEASGASRSLKAKSSKKGKGAQEDSEEVIEPVYTARGRSDPLAGPTRQQWAVLLNQAHESARYPRANPPQQSPGAGPSAPLLHTGFCGSMLTPLHAAIMAGSDAAVRELLGGAAVDAAHDALGTEAAQRCADVPSQGTCWPHHARAATEHWAGVSVLVRDCRGRSPAALALAQGMPHLALACLLRGGDLESMDDRGHNLLKYALVMPDRAAALSVLRLHESMPTTACTPFPLPALVWGRTYRSDAGAAAATFAPQDDAQEAASLIQALARGRAARHSAKMARHMQGLSDDADSQAAAAQIQALVRGRAVRRAASEVGALQHTALQLVSAAAQTTASAEEQRIGMAGASSMCSPALQVAHNCVGVFKCLVLGGADVNVSDARGNFPLHWAAGGTSLQLAVGSVDALLLSDRTEYCVMELMQFLLSPAEETGVPRSSLDAVNKACDTALHGALAAGCPAAALALLQAGAHPNLIDGKGNLPLHYCCLGRGWHAPAADSAAAVEEVEDDEALPPDVAQPLSMLRAHGRQAEVLAALLEAGQRFPLATKAFSDPRRGLSPAARAGLDTHARLTQAFQRVVHPEHLKNTSATISQLLCVQNTFGMTALHVAAAGSVTGWLAADAGLATCGVAPVPVSPVAAMHSSGRLSNLHLHARSLGSAFDASTASLCQLPLQHLPPRSLPLSVIAGAAASHEDVSMFLDIATGEVAARAAILTYALSLPEAGVTPDLPGGMQVPMCLTPALSATTGGGVGIAHFLACSWNTYARLVPQGIAPGDFAPPKHTASEAKAPHSADSTAVSNPLCAGYVEVAVPPRTPQVHAAPSEVPSSEPAAVRYYLQRPTTDAKTAELLATARSDAEACMAVWAWGGEWERPQPALPSAQHSSQGEMRLSADVTLSLAGGKAAPASGECVQPTVGHVQHAALRSWHRAYLRMLDAVVGQGPACVDSVSSPVYHTTQGATSQHAQEATFYTGAAVHAALLQQATPAWRAASSLAASVWGPAFDAAAPLWALLARGARIHPYSFDDELQQRVECFPTALHTAAAAGCGASLLAELALRQGHEELVHVAAARVNATDALHASISEMRSSAADAPGHMSAASAAATVGASRASERQVLLEGSDVAHEDILPQAQTGVLARCLSSCEMHELLALPAPRWNALAVSVPPMLPVPQGLMWTPLSVVAPALWCTGGALAVAAGCGEESTVRALAAAAVSTGGYTCQVRLGDGLGIAADAYGQRMSLQGMAGLGWNALHAAAACGSARGVALLGEALAPETLREMWVGSDAHGHLPLALAIARSDCDTVARLLQCLGRCGLGTEELRTNGQPQGVQQEAAQIYSADLLQLAELVVGAAGGSPQQELRASSLGKLVQGASKADAERVLHLVTEVNNEKEATSAE